MRLRHAMPILLALVGTDPATAACTAFGQPPTLSGPVLHTTYDPTNPANTTLSTTFTITPPSGMSPPCNLYVVLRPPQGMSNPNGSHTISYAIGGDFASAVSVGNSSSLMASLSPGVSQTFSASITIPARQTVPQGGYTDYLDLRLYATNGQFLSQSAPTATAIVTASCTLPAPNVSTLDFSQGVVNGRVSQGYKLTALIQGASCTGPARLILRGTPMQTGAAAAPGYDNRIRYQATAKLGAATTILNTDTAAEAVATTSATSGTMSIDVSLIDKGQLQSAGSYSSVLKIVLEPAN